MASAAVTFLVYKAARFILSDPFERVDPSIPPSPSANNFSGAALQLTESFQMAPLIRWSVQFPIYKVHFFKVRRYVVISDPELIKELVNNRDLDAKSDDLEELTTLTGVNGIGTTHGPQWKETHRVLAPLFNYANLEHHLFPGVVQNASNLVEEISSRFAVNGSGGRAPLQSVDIDKILVDTTYSIGSGALFGLKLGDALYAEIKSSMHALINLLNESSMRPLTAANPLYRFKVSRLRREFRGYIAALINIKRAKLETEMPSTAARMDLMESMIRAKDPETGASLDDENIIDQSATFFFGGYNTTARTLAWVVHLVSQHPTVETKLLEEIDRVLGERDVPSTVDLSQLTYLNMVVKETLRLYCPAPVYVRRALRDTKLGGYDIPEGMNVMVSILGAHYSASNFSDPSQFIPERWQEGFEKVHSYAFIPFAKGERSCLGQRYAMMQMKTVLCCIYKRLIFRPDNWSSVGVGQDLIVFPKFGIHVVPKIRELNPTACS